MPDANFDKDLNLPKGSSLYIKLVNKGDKIKFRIATTPTYETRHWVDKKTVVMCTKYNVDDPDESCKYCDQYTDAQAVGNQDLARQLKPTTTFRYPILNLATNQPGVFEFTARSIHYGIKNYADEGVDVMACDWSVERTEEKGNYYKLLRLSDKPLTEEQQESLEKAKKIMTKGRPSSSVTEGKDEPEEDPNAVANSHAEDVNPDDIPF